MKLSIKKCTSIGLAALMLTTYVFAQNVSASDKEKAFSILEKTDDVLAYHGDYSATITFQITKPNKPNENLRYRIFERTDKELMTIVQIFPEADKGKGYMRDGDNLWAYDPISRKFTHSSLKEELGDSSVKIDDVNRSDNHWKEDYDIADFKEGTLGKYSVYIITVNAISINPSYAKTTYYIEKSQNVVMKQEDFSSSGRLMRTILMPKYTSVPSGLIPVQTIIKDEINVGEQTQQVISDLTFDKLPDTIFTKAYLEGLN